MNGIFPLFERHDTVGPIAKYIDDLVLAFTIMANSSNYTFNDYMNQPDKSKFRLGYSKILNSNFKIDIPGTNLSWTYTFDNQVKPLVDVALNNLQKLNLQSVDINVDSNQFNQIFIKFFTILQDVFNCLSSCKKLAIDKYFGDSDRFQSDAKFKSFNDLYASPLLSQKWQHDFSYANVSDPAANCSSTCVNYDSFLAYFKPIFKSWFDASNIDVLFMPSRTMLPYDRNLVLQDTEFDSLDIFCSLSGYSCLNVPVGYTNPSSDDPDGLPVGMILVSKPENLMKAFQLAKLYESSYGTVKLPYTVPLLGNSVNLIMPSQLTTLILYIFLTQLFF